MILSDKPRKIGLLISKLALLLLFGSCLPRQATVSPSPHVGKAKPGHNTSILTDASDVARNVGGANSNSYFDLETYADVLGVSSKELNNASLYQLIHEWMGAPHRLGGQNKNGIDCSAFVNMAMKEIYGKNLPRTAALMADQVKRKYERQLQEGDLVFFSFGKRQIDHVGIYLANGKFVHVSTSKGVIISRLQDEWYYKYFQRAGPIL